MRLDEQSIAFFEAATGHLLAAEERAGVRHHVAVSIVGCDRVDLGYYFGKRRQEELVRSGPVPWTIVRATQFHEFAGQILERSHGPVGPVPKMLSQPVAARELAGLLVEVALGDPIGLAPDVGGPEQHLISDLARRLVAHRGQRTKIVAVPLPGKAGRQIADGGLLTGEGATILPMTLRRVACGSLAGRRAGHEAAGGESSRLSWAPGAGAARTTRRRRCRT